MGTKVGIGEPIGEMIMWSFKQMLMDIPFSMDVYNLIITYPLTAVVVAFMVGLLCGEKGEKTLKQSLIEVLAMFWMVWVWFRSTKPEPEPEPEQSNAVSGGIAKKE